MLSPTAIRAWFLTPCPLCTVAVKPSASIGRHMNSPRKHQQGPVTAGKGSCTSYWLRKMCSCCTLMRRSVSLNSYGMFQPNGPKFRLSCTSAWKKQRPYSNVLNSAFKTNASPLRIHGWFKVFHFSHPLCSSAFSESL